MLNTELKKQINALPQELRDYIMLLETNCDPAGMVQENAALRERLAMLLHKKTELERLRSVIDHPHNEDWFEGVKIEAAHQHERWGSAHDDGKSPEDWIFLAGYLCGKGAAAQKAGDIAKAMHHTISSGAAMLNWYRRLKGESCGMRPGIAPP